MYEEKSPSNLRELNVYFKSQVDNIDQIIKKAQLLQNSQQGKLNSCVRVYRYPSGLAIETLSRVLDALVNVETLDDVDGLNVFSKKGFTFELAKNDSVRHLQIEARQREMGGKNSTDIFDIGDFRLLEFGADGSMIAEADFSLYRISESIFA